jgi:hypothetical protein
MAKIIGAVNRTSRGTMGSDVIFSLRWAAWLLIFYILRM